MKYIFYYERNHDAFPEEYNTKEEALERAAWKWSYLTTWEKKHTDAFYVLESVNPDEDAENHFDGDYVKIYKLYGREERPMKMYEIKVTETYEKTYYVKATNEDVAMELLKNEMGASIKCAHEDPDDWNDEYEVMDDWEVEDWEYADLTEGEE